MFKVNFKQFLKSLAVQVLLNEQDMQLQGYNILTNKKFKHNINTNPYFSSVMSGFISKVKDIRRVEIFASITAFVGDDLFWNNLKPIVLISSLLVYIFKLNFYFLLIPFLTYFLSTNLLRLFGYEYGRKNVDNMNNFYSSFFFKRFRFFLPKIRYLLYGFFVILLLYVNLKILNSIYFYGIILLLIIWVNFVYKEFAYIFLIILGFLVDLFFWIL